MAGKKQLNHIAIIMDGNGRWAERENVERVEGHRAGAKALKRTVEAAMDLGIKYLTVYAFSTENWKRSPKEVNALMSLLRDFVDNDLAEIDEKGIRINVIGRIEQIPWITRRKLQKAIRATKNNTAGTLTLALSYGGRAEVIDATKKIAEDVAAKKIKASAIDESLFQNYLYDPELPDPELLIRTSGELRTSNFLLWQLSYSEFYFTDVLWPDFDKNELGKAVEFYNSRERRFGGR